MRRDPRAPDTWTGTVAALAKLDGRSVMGPGRLMPGAQHHGNGRRIADTALRESHFTGKLGALLE
jgi:hypothetical protein